MASSDSFGKMVCDITGPSGLRDAERLTGISAAYLAKMRNGHVPGPKLLAQFMAAYELTPTQKELMLSLAQEVRQDVTAESLFQTACEAAGLNAGQRLELLAHFRAMIEHQQKNAA